MSFRRRSLRRMVNRQLQKYKHIVEFDAVNVNMSAGTTSNVIIVGVDNPVIANTTNVSARAKVRTLYFELDVFNAAVAPNIQHFHWTFQASPNSGVAVVPPNNQGSQNPKNYVFKSGMIPVNDAAKSGKVYGTIKIPTKFQRFMNTDVIYFNIITQYNLANTDGYHLKVFYKEVRG